MLSPKPWKLDAIARLFVSVLLSFFGGALVVTVAHYRGPGGLEAARMYLMGVGALGFLLAAVLQLQRRWRYETFLRELLLLVVCFGACLVLGFWVQEHAGTPPRTSAGELMLIIEPVVLVLFARFLREHQITWAEAFGLSNGRQRAVVYGIAAACLFLPFGWGLQYASAQTMLRLHLEPREQEVVQTLLSSAAWLNQVSLGIVAIILAPIVEEIFFRGIIYPAIKQAGFPRVALWGAALMFAWMHFNVVTFLPLLLLAILLTLLYEYTNNLLASITAHALFNTVNFAVLFLIESKSH